MLDPRALTDAELAEQLREHSWPQSSQLACELEHEYSERLGRELLALDQFDVG